MNDGLTTNLRAKDGCGYFGEIQYTSCKFPLVLLTYLVIMHQLIMNKEFVITIVTTADS